MNTLMQGATRAPHTHSMNVSRFFGSTNREAMRQVRMALGAEALIVSNRRVNGGVEILAADGTSGASPVTTVSPARAVAQAPDAQRAAPLTPAARATPRPALTPTVAAPAPDPANLMQAITGLRAELELRMDDLAWNQQVKTAPQALSLFQTLLERGFSTALLRPLLQHCPVHASAAAALAWARSALLARLPVGAGEDALWQPGLTLALVGPTGVGKTTTLAKLAARAVRRFGAQNVTLITTDTYRIGASEQLNIYGQVLRTAVHVAHDAAALQRIVQALPADHVILIDNVGVSQRDRAVQAQAALLRAAGRPVARLLVLNAASHGDTLDEVARTYANDGGAALAGCIVSKVDEALRLAPVIDTAIRHQLPIHYVSAGQKVPEHLACVPAAELFDQALAAGTAVQTLYAPRKADLAALMTLGEERRVEDESRRLHDLIALSLPAGATLSPELARQAFAEIDAHPVCRAGFAVWQAERHAPPMQHAGMVQEQRQEQRQRSHAPTVRAGDTLVVMHDETKFAQGRLTWAQTGILARDAGFQPIAIPVHIVNQTHAWEASWGERALGNLDASQARCAQVQALRAQAPDALHVFEGGTPRLWRAVQDLDVAWLGTCAPGTVVVVDDTPTRAATLARQAVYRPLDTRAWQLGLQSCAGKTLEELEVWCAADAVQLRARGAGVQSLRLIHLRLQDRADGSLIRQWSALTNTPLAEAALAHALTVRCAQAPLARSVQAIVRQRPPAREHAPAPHPSTQLALDLALATWCIQQSATCARTRQVLACLTPRTKPTAHDTAAGVLRLLALKEMVG